MQKIVILLLCFFAFSCSSKKYDYRGNSQSYGGRPANVNARPNPYRDPSAFGSNPYGATAHPPATQIAPSVSKPQYPYQYQTQPVPTRPVPQYRYQAEKVPAKKAPLPYDLKPNAKSNTYYPYNAQSKAPANKNLLQNYHGKRAAEQVKRPVAPPSPEAPQKPPRDFSPITGGYEKKVTDVIMKPQEKNKFGLLSSDSFSPGSQPSETYRGFSNSPRSGSKKIKNLDDNILDGLISSDPLSTGFYPDNIPSYQ